MTLHKHAKTLLVIVTEAALEARLVRDARERGAQGWTVGEVHGGETWRSLHGGGVSPGGLAGYHGPSPP